MRLDHFLDAAFAVLVEEYQRHLNMNLFDALDAVAEWKAGYSGEEKLEETAQQISDDREAIQNEQALAQLRALLGGV